MGFKWFNVGCCVVEVGVLEVVVEGVLVVFVQLVQLDNVFYMDDDNFVGLFM